MQKTENLKEFKFILVGAEPDAVLPKGALLDGALELYLQEKQAQVKWI